MSNLEIKTKEQELIKLYVWEIEKVIQDIVGGLRKPYRITTLDGTIYDLGGVGISSGPEEIWLNVIFRGRNDFKTLNQFLNLANSSISEASNVYYQLYPKK